MTEANSLRSLKGVGPRMVERLAKLNIHSLADLLFHLPLRYQDRSRVRALGSLRPGEEVLAEGTVELSEIKFGRRRMLLVQISDASGSILLRFFHFSNQQKQQLARGVRLRCFAEVRRGPQALEMVHPEYQIIPDTAEPEAPSETEKTLTPVYPVTEGLHQIGLRKLMAQMIESLTRNEIQLEELLPPALLAEKQMPTLTQALLFIHQPPTDTCVSDLQEARHPAYQRLIFEELLAHYLSLRQLRHRRQKHVAPALKAGGYARCFIDALPFVLTGAQQRVYTEIQNDLQQPRPMQRLVQGDVGSGKTVIAVLAALAAVEQGYQAAIMAPTEILAEQHFHNIERWMKTLAIRVTWLSGKLKSAQRKEALTELADGASQIAVGTHALFQNEVCFARLGLVVVDEQHRFGVHQRLALREKGRVGNRYPHQLIMTATPIPRTLSMAAYADLDISVIDELPPGRKPVETVVIPESRRDEVVQRVHRACQQGKQVYWVCTLIEESEALQCQAAEDTAEKLQVALRDVKTALVHGRMKATEKEAVMQAFKQGEIDLLVATTVIEVGVDVANASLMIIENAERLGLAQLHQLRGRVGRGEQASVCVLMYKKLSQQARERLGVMRETSDGFEIARRDLALRGPGEILGTRQTGLLQLKIADLQRDQRLVEEVARVADDLLQDNPVAAEALIERWTGAAAHFAEV
ncbi:ATP-dependent DNA helicase RecG [hydrothermal vent metagenome]|uniref:ATP-dependent DNA helicase RecG n=1 Tax=hydrothermal vent metagenome TaxID=652676 RepID=A0A3B1BMK1_9ZZZZ